MDDNARKYLLDVGSIMSSGLSSCCTTIEHNLLDAFTVVTGTVTGIGGITFDQTCSFPQISLDYLSNMSVPDYDKRVTHFFENIGLEEKTLKQNLLSGATFYDPTCDFPCGLNSNFLVYRFLDGVRVVNVGNATGVVEYKAYPVGDDPNTYSWQESGTFLGLDLSKLYVFIIRDNLSSEIICEYQKEISLPILLPSTTATLTPILVAIDETSRNESSNTCFSHSCVIPTPNLVSGQRIDVDYVVNTEAFGGGESCVSLYCKEPLDLGYVEYCKITNTDTTPETVDFQLDHETLWCYSVVAATPIAGASAGADFYLNSVNGLGTNIPSIDTNNCSISVESCQQPVNVTASTNTASVTYPPFGGQSAYGIIEFDNPIPDGNCVTMSMVVTTIITGSADASVTFSCQPDGSGVPIIISTTTGLQTVPVDIVARHGDEISYTLYIDADTPGTEATASFLIDSMSGSYGVNTYIDPNNKSALIEDGTTPTPITVSVCSSYNTTSSPLDVYAEMNGYINAPGIGAGQYVTVDLCMNVQRPHGFATLEVSCQPDGTTGYNAICTMAITNDEIITFNMYAGDIICYCGEASPIALGGDALAWGYLCLDSVSGVGGISASINSTTAKQCDCVAAYDPGI